MNLGAENLRLNFLTRTFCYVFLIFWYCTIDGLLIDTSIYLLYIDNCIFLDFFDFFFDFLSCTVCIYLIVVFLFVSFFLPFQIMIDTYSAVFLVLLSYIYLFGYLLLFEPHHCVLTTSL